MKCGGLVEKDMRPLWPKWKRETLMAIDLVKIKGSAAMSALMKKLRGGSQSILPFSPGKGTGTKSFKGKTPKRIKQFSAPRQNPALSGGLNAIRRKK